MKARVRRDLISQGLSVPVGYMFYGGTAYLPARWIGDTFQVFLNKEWLKACSIDWETYFTK